MSKPRGKNGEKGQKIELGRRITLSHQPHFFPLKRKKTEIKTDSTKRDSRGRNSKPISLI